MTAHSNFAGSWRQVKTLHVRHGGAWKDVLEGWVNEAGTWKQFYFVPPQTGIQQVSAGVYQIVGFSTRATYLVSASAGAATVDANGLITHSGATSAVITVVTQVGALVTDTRHIERRPHVYYTHTWTTGGTYDYDCSYGARAEQYQSGTQHIQGDNQTPYCPGGWSVAHVDCGGVWCRHSDGRFQQNGWLSGCPGGWSGCNCGACCTSVPVYSTRYHCDSGGSLSGTTCHKTCQGNNTQTHSEQRLQDEPGFTNSGGEWWRVTT